MRIRAVVRPAEEGLWRAESEEPRLEATGESLEACIEGFEREVTSRAGVRGQPLTIVFDAPRIVAGVAEAAAILGWDKRRVSTYIARGRFPEPIQILASGRVWLREDIERFAADRRARRRERVRPA